MTKDYRGYFKDGTAWFSYHPLHGKVYSKGKERYESEPKIHYAGGSFLREHILDPYRFDPSVRFPSRRCSPYPFGGCCAANNLCSSNDR